jgi:hypothetical protein
VKQSNGDTAWRRPNYAAIHRMIENPEPRRVCRRRGFLSQAAMPVVSRLA